MGNMSSTLEFLVMRFFPMLANLQYSKPCLNVKNLECPNASKIKVSNEA